jgi:hypothetical protein
MGTVVPFRKPKFEEDDISDETEFGGGDGGDVVIRIVIEGDFDEIEPEPEEKGSNVGAFFWGALAGFLIGG